MSLCCRAKRVLYLSVAQIESFVFVSLRTKLRTNDGSMYLELCENGSSNQLLNDFKSQDNLTIGRPLTGSSKIP